MKDRFTMIIHALSLKTATCIVVCLFCALLHDRMVFAFMHNPDVSPINERTAELNIQNEHQDTKNDSPTHTFYLTEEETAWLAAHPKITLGTDERWTPYVIQKEDGRIDGIEAELISRINAMTGANIQIALGYWADMVEKAQKREIDGLLVSAYHQEREADFLFTNSPYSIYKYIYIQKGSSNTIQKMADLTGKRVAFLKGNQAEEKLLRRYSEINMLQVDSADEAVSLLYNGKADAFISSINFRRAVVEKMIPDIDVAFIIPESETPILYTIRKDWPELVSIINKALAQIPQNQKLEIIEKWTGKFGISSDILRSLFSREEKKWLAAHPVIRVGIDPQWAPVEYVNKEGKFQGMSADYLAWLERLLGVDFEAAVDLTWQEALVAGKEGRLDMFTSMRRTKERSTYMDFTTPYISMPIVIFTGPALPYVGDIKELDNKKVAVIEEYAVHEILESDHPAIQLVVCRNSEEALQKLEENEVYAFIDNMLTASFYINRMGLTQIKVAGKTPYSYDQTMAVTKKNAVLRGILQKALNAIPESEHNAIYQRWVSVQHERWFNYRLLWKIMGVALLVFGGILYVNRRLATEVRKRTSDLNASNALLVESEERYKQMFLNSTAIKLLIDPADGVVLDANKAACDFYQYSREQILGLNFNDITMLSREKIAQEEDRAKKEKRHYINSRHKLANGDIKDVEVYSGPIIVKGKTLFFLIVHDISTRKELEIRLLQVQKMEAIGTLAGGIAHDFNNILSIMLGYTEIAMLNAESESRLHAELDRILKAGNRAKELVQQILSFSRQTEKELRPVKPHLLVKEVLKLLRSTLPSTIEIHQNINNCGTILGDHTQLHQVIMNLCTNAYHAMRETGGTLVVELQPIELTTEDINQLTLKLTPGSYIRLEVSDTGSGMSKATLSKIFDPYFTTKEKGEGTGLGLAIVHGIVKGYGGDITVFSEIGVGSTFYVYLPNIASDAEIQTTGKQQIIPNGKNERILLVDDEEHIAQMSDAMLKNLGYHVEIVTSSVIALAEFENRPSDFDLVITDMTMPKMTGAELTQKMLDIRPDIPVILYTGFSDLINEDKAKAIGVKAFITKPVMLKELAVTIRDVLDNNPFSSTNG